MKTFVINLKKSVNRKERMIKILSNYSNILETTFIEAIDGKEFFNSYGGNYHDVFNYKESRKKYGRDLHPGEIGCTLSHRKCYQEIIKSNNYALILEDDIRIKCDSINIIERLIPYVSRNTPTIILLSNNVWYTKKKKLNDNYCLLNVYDALYAHAYIINKEAAKLILDCSPFYLADDWKFIKELGIKLYSLYPHLTEQFGYDIMESNICNDHKGRPNILYKMSYRYMFERICRAITRRILRFIKHKTI